MFGERTQEERSGADWLNKGEGGTEIGWGRRIYDKNEIEVRQRQSPNNDAPQLFFSQINQLVGIGNILLVECRGSLDAESRAFLFSLGSRKVEVKVSLVTATNWSPFRQVPCRGQPRPGCPSSLGSVRQEIKALLPFRFCPGKGGKYLAPPGPQFRFSSRPQAIWTKARKGGWIIWHTCHF